MAEPRTGTATPWHDEIERYSKAADAWARMCASINKLYTRENSASKFAILWANIQTLQPAVYARAPQGVVSRRFKDADPVARTATEVLERAINYCVSAYDLDRVLLQVRDDYLLYARGTAWVRYEPIMRQVPLEDVQTGADPYQTDTLDEDGEPREDDAQAPDSYEEIDFERVICDYVHRQDFGHTVARTWGEVWAVWRKAYLTRSELVDRFGDELGKKIPLDHTPAGIAESADPADRERTCKATIYEIWSKRDRKVFFIAHDHPDVLEEVEPFLTLTGFWPCPRPAFGTLTNDSLLPIPDYKFYEDQAEEIDRLTLKIDVLEKSLQLVGFYPSGPSREGSGAIKQAMETRDVSVKLIPVEGWAAFQEKGGASAVTWLPIGQVVEALTAAVDLRERIISDVYQITGISDIVRGDTNPNETYGAQAIKAQWGSIRIRDRQMALAQFSAEIISITGQIIAKKFQPETLSQMTGIQLVAPPMDPAMMMDPNAMQQMQAQQQEMQAVIDLLRNDAQRGFRIEIETDSTVEPDQTAEKNAAIELVGVLGQFFTQTVPMLQMFPQAAPLAGQTLLLALRRFRAGRELEATVEQLAEQISQMQPPQQGPDPAAMQAEQQAQQQVMQQQAEVESQKTQMQLQATQAKTQAIVTKAEADIATTQADTQAHMIRNQTDIERMQAEAALGSVSQGVPQ